MDIPFTIKNNRNENVSGIVKHIQHSENETECCFVITKIDDLICHIEASIYVKEFVDYGSIRYWISSNIIRKAFFESTGLNPVDILKNILIKTNFSSDDSNELTNFMNIWAIIVRYQFIRRIWE